MNSSKNKEILNYINNTNHLFNGTDHYEHSAILKNSGIHKFRILFNKTKCTSKILNMSEINFEKLNL